MSWLQKLLPPKIQRTGGGTRKTVPEGLWTKCPACDAVLYSTDLEKNLNVCPKCGHHERFGARPRLDTLLDPDGRFEIGAEVLPLDPLKFRDSRRYAERLTEAQEQTAEGDALVVMQGSIKALGLVCAAFEFDFMGGSMGSVVGERLVRQKLAEGFQRAEFRVEKGAIDMIVDRRQMRDKLHLLLSLMLKLPAEATAATTTSTTTA